MWFVCSPLIDHLMIALAIFDKVVQGALSIPHCANAAGCETIGAHLSKEPSKTMDREQAKRLGGHLRQARDAKGLSAKQLGELTNMNDATIVRIENGSFAAPAADKLARLAEALDLSLADVYGMADYAVPSDLPSFTPYMRSKYKEMPDEAVEQIERYAQKLAKKHGINLAGPTNGQDEGPDKHPKP